jgi:hypothetical protein
VLISTLAARQQCPSSDYGTDSKAPHTVAHTVHQQQPALTGMPGGSLHSWVAPGVTTAAPKQPHCCPPHSQSQQAPARQRHVVRAAPGRLLPFCSVCAFEFGKRTGTTSSKLQGVERLGWVQIACLLWVGRWGQYACCTASARCCCRLMHTLQACPSPPKHGALPELSCQHCKAGTAQSSTRQIWSARVATV